MPSKPISLWSAAVVLAGMLLAAAPTAATPVHLSGQATTSAGPTQYIALGTVVSADLRFDVSGTTSTSGGFPTISQVQGSFSWNDGAQRTVDVGPLFLGSNSVSGHMEFVFASSGPVIGGLTAELFSFTLDIGTNPFVNGLNWDTLLLESTVTGFGALVGPPGGSSSRLSFEQNVVASISAVPLQIPEPDSLALLALGLAGLWVSAARRLPNSVH